MNAHWSVIETPLVPVPLAESGSGPSVIYLHDVLFDHVAPSGDMPELLAILSESHRLHAPALPGFRDLKQLSAFEDLADYVLFVRDLIDALSLERPHLVGTGLGGWLAAETAVFYPDAISTLTLVNAFGLMVEGHPIARYFDAAAPNPLGGRREIRHLLFADPDGSVAQQLMPDFPDDDANQAFFTNVHAAARIGWHPPAFYDPRLVSRLHRVTVPTHVIWGGSNSVADMEHGRTYASKIPQAALTTIEGAGHAITVEQPNELAKAVTSFVDRHEER